MLKIVITKCTTGEDLYELKYGNQHLPLVPNSPPRKPGKTAMALAEEVMKLFNSGELAHDNIVPFYHTVKNPYEKLWNDFKKNSRLLQTPLLTRKIFAGI